MAGLPIAVVAEVVTRRHTRGRDWFAQVRAQHAAEKAELSSQPAGKESLIEGPYIRRFAGSSRHL
jgi:hypothetical protein